jgi:hypothetical protein
MSFATAAIDLSLVILDVVRRQRQWPPEYPRKGTLLCPPSDPQLPKEEWGREEWKAYALFLEQAGASLIDRLIRSEREASDSRVKLSRRRVGEHGDMRHTLLTQLQSVPGKRGRKPSTKTQDEAREVLGIRAEMEAKGRRVTDKQAIEEWLQRKGLGRYRASERPGLVNAICRIRTSHKISKT